MVTKNKKNCTCKKSELELSLIESEERFRLLMELATDGVLIVQDGKIKEVNYYLAKNQLTFLILPTFKIFWFLPFSQTDNPRPCPDIIVFLQAIQEFRNKNYNILKLIKF